MLKIQLCELPNIALTYKALDRHANFVQVTVTCGPCGDYLIMTHECSKAFAIRRHWIEDHLQHGCDGKENVKN